MWTGEKFKKLDACLVIWIKLAILKYPEKLKGKWYDSIDKAESTRENKHPVSRDIKLILIKIIYLIAIEFSIL